MTDVFVEAKLYEVMTQSQRISINILQLTLNLAQNSTMFKTEARL